MAGLLAGEIAGPRKRGRLGRPVGPSGERRSELGPRGDERVGDLGRAVLGGVRAGLVAGLLPGFLSFSISFPLFFLKQHSTLFEFKFKI